MKQYRVIFSARARKNLTSIEDYFEGRFGPEAAASFTDEVISDCNDLQVAPKRGMLRPEVGRDVRRIGGAKSRVAIMFRVEEDSVVILGVRYTGPMY